MEWWRHRFELGRGAHNMRPMEGLRGFAVFLVFLVHYVTLVEPWISPQHSSLLRLAGAMHAVGNTGVDLFFVLSGYLIYGSLIGRRQPFLRFMSRRIERIFPAFLAVFAVYVALSFAMTSESKLPATGAAVYLLQNVLLLPGLFPITPLVTVAWSLSYEMFYYLAIPVVIDLARLRERSSAWRVGFFLILAAVGGLLCAVYGGPLRLVMFIAGILLHEVRNRVPAPSSALGLAALVAGLASTLLPIGPFKIAALFVAFFLVCFTCFRNAGWLARGFTWTPVRWLGNMSYSYYLIHGLSLKAAFLVLAYLLPKAGYGPWFFWLLLPPMFAATLIPSTALFLAIERPFSLVPSAAPAQKSSRWSWRL